MPNNFRKTLLASMVAASLAVAGSSAVAGNRYDNEQQARFEQQDRSQQQGRYEQQDRKQQKQDRQHTRQQVRDEQRRGERTQTAGAGLDRMERRIAQKEMNLNAGSIEIARVAEQRSDNEQLRDFARDVISENRKANQSLASLSQNLRVGRAEPTQIDQWAVDRLQSIRNPVEFQQAFTELMVARTQLKAELLSMIANNERIDPQLRQHAQRQVQDLRGQLQVAQQLQDDLGTVAGTDFD